jgi:carbamoyl-phosphate synthase large subunit
LRYASGGLPLSVVSGIDLSTLLIELMDDRPIDNSRYQSDRKIRVMQRFYDERFYVL